MALYGERISNCSSQCGSRENLQQLDAAPFLCSEGNSIHLCNDFESTYDATKRALLSVTIDRILETPLVLDKVTAR